MLSSERTKTLAVVLPLRCSRNLQSAICNDSAVSTFRPKTPINPRHAKPLPQNFLRDGEVCQKLEKP